MVLILVLLGAVILTPLLSFTIGGMKQGQSNENKKNEFYAADAGIEDAMWKIRNYEDSDWPAWMQGDWTESTYTNDPAGLEYTIAGGVNAKGVTVRIQPIWILEGMELHTYSADKRTLDDNVTVVGNVTSAGKYEAAILKSDNFTGPLMIDRIGVWLPTGFKYTPGSSNLESYSNCVVTEVPFRNGTAIEWNFSTPINYGALPAEKSGKANQDKKDHLVDTINHQFTTADVGRSVYNITDDKWGMITGYVSTSGGSDVTVSPTYSAGPPVVPDLFDTGKESYQIGEANRRVVSFSFTSTSSVGVPDGAFCWVRSPGNTTPTVAPYLWWSASKVYQIVSTGTDPSTGKLTTITAYTTKEQLKDFGGSMNADYVGIGNTLLMDYNVDNPYGEGDRNGSERGDGLYRDRLYESSPAQLTSLPAGANLQQLRLYWSGWKNYPWNVWPYSQANRQLLVSQSFVDRVDLKVEVVGVAGLAYETTVVADSWQVLPNGTSSVPRGWNYSCYADVTDEVEAARTYFEGQGVDFIGNATKYTVGHADSSDFTTQPLQGIWGSSASDVFLVGQGGSILHYDGITWDLMDTGITSNLYGVWGSSATDVFAVGQSGTILHYDGTSWSVMTSPTPNELRGVWGSSATGDVFAVGASGTICHYSSGSWHLDSSGTTDTLYGVWGSSSSDVWAVGGRTGTTTRGTVCHYLSGSWTATQGGTAGGGTQPLYSVWGTAANNVFAVGANGTIRKYVSSWTGTTSGTSNLYGVWGYDSTHVYAVGASGTVRYTSNGGTAWGAMTGGSGTTSQLNGIWGNASDNILAVGSGGIVIQYDGFDANDDGSFWDPVIGDTSLYGWKDSHSGEIQVDKPAYPLADRTSYDNGRLDQAAYGAWSMIVIYSAPETKGHQLYLDDTFRFYWNPNNPTGYVEGTFLFEDFLAPQDVLTDPNAARLTCFVAEGDDVLTGDSIWVNDNPIFGGVPYACNPVDNVWNSKSSVAGMENIGIDIDTFALAYPIIKPGDTSATVRVRTNGDGWFMVYMIMSFRSDITSGGIGSIKVT